MEEGYVKGVVTTDGQTIRGDIVIGCDGAHSTVARKSGFWNIWFDRKGETWMDHMWFCVGVEVKMDSKTIDERFQDSYLFFTGREVAPWDTDGRFQSEKSSRLVWVPSRSP
ncbi:MAG: hypothetical protein Q6352_012070 [Candidatus Freyrarchaeum guaymaensis]